MEDWKILILIGAILILMAGAWYCIKLSLEDYKKRIWVYTKNGLFLLLTEIRKVICILEKDKTFLISLLN